MLTDKSLWPSVSASRSGTEELTVGKTAESLYPSSLRSSSHGSVPFLPWARRTRVGSRNLLTTASSGSANWLQAISDRLADSFSILPAHHGTGQCGGGGGADGDVNDEEAEDGEGGGGGGGTGKSFAMFACRRVGPCARAREEGGREREPSSSARVLTRARA